MRHRRLFRSAPILLVLAILLLTTAFVTPALAGGKPGGGTSTTAPSIKGYVTAAKGGSGLLVNVNAYQKDRNGNFVLTYVTNSRATDGYYEFMKLPSGTYKLHFQIYGLVDQYNGGAADLASAAPLTVKGGQTVAVDAAMVGIGWIDARADWGGGAVKCAGTTFTLYGNGFVESFMETGQIVFRNLPPGSYKVHYSSAGYAPAWYGGTTFEDATPIQIGGPSFSDPWYAQAFTQLEGLSEMRGVVTDSVSGAPLAGATVKLEIGNTGIQKAFTLVTGADGSYSLGGLPPFVVWWSVSADHHVAIPRGNSTYVYLEPNSVLEKNIALDPAFAVSGRITDAVTATPISDVLVRFRALSGTMTYAYTDSDGIYSTVLPAGTYDVVMGKDGYLPFLTVTDVSADVSGFDAVLTSRSTTSTP